MRERTVEAHFVKRVVETGGITRKAQWIGRWGCPDRWCGWPGLQRTCWAELKGDGGRLSKHQQLEIDRLHSCGEQVWVLRSIEEVDTFIRCMTG